MKSKPPAFVAVKSRFLRCKRIRQAVRDAEQGLKDTEKRGAASDVLAMKSRV